MNPLQHTILKIVRSKGVYRESLNSLINGAFRGIIDTQPIYNFAHENSLSVMMDPIPHPMNPKKLDYLVTFYPTETTPKHRS